MENKATIIVTIVVALILFAVIALVIIFGGDKKTTNSTNSTSSQNSTFENEKTENSTNEQSEFQNYDFEEAAEKQMADAESGETIAIMHVKNFGDIKFKFFTEKTPKAVENFLTHAQNGYYDGVKFHRVIEDFMIQGGDPQGTGYGGESIWGKGFEEELDESLVPYRGALCMASSGTGTSSLGSQFFIVQANADDAIADQMSAYGYPEKLTNCYKKYGGYLSLYGSYTVFGQVIEGMDVVDKIAKVDKSYSSNGELSVPNEDIIIESIDVTVQQ